MKSLALRLVCAAVVTLVAANSSFASGVKRLPDAVPGEYLVSLAVKGDTARVADELAREYGGSVERVWEGLNGFWIHVPDAADAEALSADPRVALVEQNQNLRFSADIQPTRQNPVNGLTTDDNRLWHLDRIDQDSPDPLDGKYNYCSNGTGVTVFVVDHGVKRNHSEFGSTDAEQRARVLDGEDVTDEDQETFPCGDLTRELYDFSAGQFIGATYIGNHGTSAASLVNGINVGVAKGAKVVPVKISRCVDRSATNWAAQRAYRTGTLVWPPGRLVALKAVIGGVSGDVLDFTPSIGSRFNDGSVTWQVITARDANPDPNPEPPNLTEAEAAQIVHTAYLVSALEWVRTIGLSRLPVGERAVVTLSTFAVRWDVSETPLPLTNCSNLGNPKHGDDLTLLERSVKGLVAREVTVVASANNQDYPACATAPGHMEEVITVGGSMLVNDPDGDLSAGARDPRGAEPQSDQPVRDALWKITSGDSSPAGTGEGSGKTVGSNWGPDVKIFAPAKNITSALASSPVDYRNRLLFGYGSGTSWSAPIVAGVVARMLSMGHSTRYLDVKNTLKATAIEGALDPNTLRGSPNLLVRASDVVFQSQPEPKTIAAGGGAVGLSVRALGPSALTYQWYEGAYRNKLSKNTLLAGKTAADVHVDVQKTSYFFVDVTGTCDANPAVPVGNTSRVVKVVVNGQVSFAGTSTPSAPQYRLIVNPATSPGVTLTAPFVTAPGPVTYTWYEGQPGQTGSKVCDDIGICERSTASIVVKPTKLTTYWVRVSLDGSPNDFVDSDPVRVEVRGPLAVERTSAPRNAEVTLTLEGDVFHLPLEWRDNGQIITTCAGAATCRPSISDPNHTFTVFTGTSGETFSVDVSRCGDPPAFPSIEIVDGSLQSSLVGDAYQWFAGPAYSPHPPSSANPTPRQPQFGRPIPGATGRKYTPNVIADDTLIWLRLFNGTCGASGPSYADSGGSVVRPNYKGKLLPQPNFALQELNAQELILVANSPAPLSIFEWYYGQSGNTTDRIAGASNWYLNASRLPEPRKSHLVWARVWTWDRSQFVDSQAFAIGAETCNITLATTQLPVPAGSGVYTVNVNLNPFGCTFSWAAVSDSPWVTILSGSNNVSGVVRFSVAANTTPNPRVAVIDVSGQKLTITQAGATCDVVIAPESGNYGPGGGVGEFEIVTTCDWTATVATEDLTFISLVGPNNTPVQTRSGTGRTFVRFFLSAFDTYGARSAPIRVGNKAFFVNQVGDGSTFCPTIAIQPSDLNITDTNNVVLNTLGRGIKLTYEWFVEGVASPIGTGEQLILEPGDAFYPQPPPGGSITKRFFARVSRPDLTCAVQQTRLASVTVSYVDNPIACRSQSPKIAHHPQSVLGARPTHPVILSAVTDPDSADVWVWQWYWGIPPDRSAPISEERGGKTTNPRMTSLTVHPRDSQYYWVEAFNGCAGTMSGAARVEVSSKGRVVRKDYNNDRKEDAAWFNKNTGAAEAWLMNGANPPTVVGLPPGTPGQEMQAIGDLNGDTFPDFLWRDPDTGQNAVNFGGGNLPLQSQSDTDWSIGAAADMEGDGNDDLIWHNRTTGEMRIWFMEGMTQIGSWSLGSAPTTGWRPQGQTDFNGDEIPDLLFRNYETGENAAWLMTDELTVSPGLNSKGIAINSGDGMRGVALEPLPDPNWQVAALGDFNADTRPDIFWFNAATGQTQVWALVGTTKIASIDTPPQTNPDMRPGGAGPPADSTPQITPTSLSLSATSAQYGTSTVLTATLGAGGTPVAGKSIAFAVDGSSVGNAITDASGTATVTASLTGLVAGSHSATAIFAGDQSHGASNASSAFDITRASQQIAWAPPAPIVYGTALSISQLNAVVTVSGPASAGTLTYSPLLGTVLDAGDHTLTVTAQATPEYEPATATVVLRVEKATTVITWPQPAAITYGAILSATQLNATASTPGTFVYSPAAGTQLNAGTHTLTVSFTPASANFSNATAETTLVVRKATQSITWPTPAAIVYGTPLSATQLNATATAGALSYAPPAGTILDAGTHTLTANAAGTANYEPASATVTLQVQKATPAITWPQPAAITYGGVLSSAQLNATASTPGTFVYSPAAGTQLSAGSHTLTASFTPASANFTSATAQVTLVVNKATQTIHWATPTPIVYGTALSSSQLNATVSVVGPAPAGALTYAPSTGTVLDAGTHTLTVNAAGTANYEPASATVTLHVEKATPLITWPQPAAITYGDVLSNAQLNATASTPGTFIYSPAAGMQLSAGSHTLTASFTPSSANFTTATVQVTLVVNKARQTIRWTTPAPIVYGTPLSSSQLNATVTVVGPSPAGALTYTPNAGTILNAGDQTLSVSAAGTSDYEPAAASVVLHVEKATPSVTWARPASIVYGTALSSEQLNATADVPGTFNYTPASGTILNAGLGQTLTTVFTPSDTANYRVVTSTNTIDVAKAPQSLSWSSPAPIVYGTPLGATQLSATVSVVGPAAAGALSYSPPAGTVLDAGTGRVLTVTAAETSNYLSATLSRSIDVNRAPLSVIAADASKLYGASLPPLTGTLTGVVNGDAITASYTTIATMASPAGAYAITPVLSDPNGRLVNYTVTTRNGTLTISPAPLVVRADDKTKQYSDPLPPLTASFIGLVLGETPSVLTGALTFTASVTPTSAVGTYPIGVSGLTSPNYAIQFVPGTLTVIPEDARITFTASRIVSATGPKSTDVIVVLAATVQDISDGSAGDIRQATIRFVDRTTGATLCTATPQLFAPPDATTATVACTWTTALTGTGSTVNVGLVVGGAYLRDAASDDVSIFITAPGTRFVTGGGYLVAARSAGALAADAGTKMTFTVEARYNAQPDLHGAVDLAFERGGRKYRVRSTRLQSLATSASGDAVAVTGLATIEDHSERGKAVTIASDAVIVLTAGADRAAITVHNRVGRLWFATAWDGVRPVEEAVAGGNIKIH